MKVLLENATHRLELERLQGKYWLSLVTRTTGNTQCLICTTKKIALEAFQGMELPEIAAFMNRAKVPFQPCYKKEGVLTVDDNYNTKKQLWEHQGDYVTDTGSDLELHSRKHNGSKHFIGAARQQLLELNVMGKPWADIIGRQFTGC